MADFAYENLITNIPDYPEPGVQFKDITTLLSDAQGFHAAVKGIADAYRDAGITKVLGAEARGFILGSPVAFELGCGFVPVRKPGKLPRQIVSCSYDLEYGSNSLEIHVDAIGPDDKVLIVDDLVATGGTAIAQAKMVRQMGARLAGMAFMIELVYLDPRKAISAYDPDLPVRSLIEVR